MDSIDTIRAFLAVAETGSFTAAAERLEQSRAVTSKYVAHLEARLGARLLNRTTRHVEMSSAGRAYQDRAHRIVADFDDLEAAMRDQRQVPGGRLRIAAPVTFTELFLSPVIAEFSDRYPDISIELSLADRHVNLIAEGIDVALRVGELTDESLVARRLSTATLVLCAAPSYIESHGRPFALSELSDHRCVLDANRAPPDHWSYCIDGILQTVRVRGPVSVNSARVVRSLVLAGKGIGLCPSFMVADDIKTNTLVPLLHEHRQPEFGIHAVYPHNRHLSPAVRVFIDHLVDRVPSLCGR